MTQKSDNGELVIVGLGAALFVGLLLFSPKGGSLPPPDPPELKTVENLNTHWQRVAQKN